MRLATLCGRSGHCTLPSDQRSSLCQYLPVECDLSIRSIRWSQEVRTADYVPERLNWERALQRPRLRTMPEPNSIMDSLGPASICGDYQRRYRAISTRQNSALDHIYLASKAALAADVWLVC